MVGSIVISAFIRVNSTCQCASSPCLDTTSLENRGDWRLRPVKGLNASEKYLGTMTNSEPPECPHCGAPDGLDSAPLDDSVETGEVVYCRECGDAVVVNTDPRQWD